MAIEIQSMEKTSSGYPPIPVNRKKPDAGLHQAFIKESCQFSD